VNEQKQMLDEWINRFGKKLIQLSFYYMKEKMAAEDIVQDVFIKVYSNIEQFENHPNIDFLLCRMTINRSKDVMKSWVFRKQRLVKVFPITESKSDLPEAELIKKVSENELMGSILSLSIKYREVILLFYFEGYKTREIAELLNEKESTVRVRLSRGIKKLRDHIQEEETFLWNV
jgi:RNA polymerase sigma-70 factor (ECF subfamily)